MVREKPKKPDSDTEESTLQENKNDSDSRTPRGVRNRSRIGRGRGSRPSSGLSEKSDETSQASE